MLDRLAHWSHFRLAGLICGVVASLAVSFGSAAMAQNARSICRDVLRLAEPRVVWQAFRDTADAHFCRKDWVTDRPGELMACGDPRTLTEFTAANAANTNAALSSNTPLLALGPSSAVGRAAGRPAGFVHPALSRNTLLAQVRFSDMGTAPAYAAMCTIGVRGGLVGAALQGWPLEDPATGAPTPFPGTDRSYTFTVPPRDATQMSFIALAYDRLDGQRYPPGLGRPGGQAGAQPMYQVRARNVYNCPDCGIRGAADLHVHQMAELGFAGRLLWGSHTGPAATALPPDVLTADTTLAIGSILAQLALGRPLQSIITDDTGRKNGVDANKLMQLFTGQPTDEGEVVLEVAGAPNFNYWPHHADRAHQQVHSSWLRYANNARRSEGHNLSLMVASMVHNDVLCEIFRRLDPRGNVPTTGDVGSISADWGCTDWENLNRQIDAVHALERITPWYRVALTPWHAEQIILSDDLAVVISLESDVPLSDANAGYDGDSFLTVLDHYRRRGVRSLQPVHESDSIFCGAALHRESMDALQIVHNTGLAAEEMITARTPFNIDRGSLRNRLGLTADGVNLIGAMVERNMPIDLAHSAIKCQKDIFQTVPVGYGLYNSHTKFERLLRPALGQPNYGSHVIAREKNFLISEDLEQPYLDHEVMIGLRTASIDVYDAPNFLPGADLYFVPNDCPGSSKSFAQMVKYAGDKGFDFAYGTDFNTGVSQLGPRQHPDGGPVGACYAASHPNLNPDFQSTRPLVHPVETSLGLTIDESLSPSVDETEVAGKTYWQDGLAHIGLLPELGFDLEYEIPAVPLPVGRGTTESPDKGMPAAGTLTSGAANFIAMWRRAYDFGAPRPGPSPIPATGRAVGDPCVGNTQCASNRCADNPFLQGEAKVCVCTDTSHCAAGLTCATPLLGENFCVAEGQRMVGETCYSDLACDSGRCDAVDGAKGVCRCRTQGQSFCKVGFSCEVRTSVPSLLAGVVTANPFVLRAKNTCVP